jgi:PAT family beta-lactamase induction signal transducer AmpG
VNLTALKVYRDPRLIAIAFLGVSSGLPLALTMSTLSLWLAESGVNRATIGAFALVGLPYSIKFLWAPIIDHVRLPLLTKIFGQRRGWMLLTQILLAVSVYFMGQVDPRTNIGLMSMLAVAVTFFSASQDVVIDAFRIEVLDEKSYGAGAAMIVFGYRVGMIISSAGALFLAASLSWDVVYALMALCLSFGVITTLLCREPKRRMERALIKHKLGVRVYQMIVGPFVDFIKKPQWMLILFFIVFYKLGDAFLGNMLSPFYLDMGFSKTEIASVTKVFGLGATLLGGFAGGVLVYRFGMLRALLICGVLQVLSNLVFVGLAYEGHSVPALMAAIGAENFSSGMGGAAFVAYLSSLCSLSFTASQYALLSALASTGRTFFSAGAGILAEATSWPIFFVVSAAIAVPGIFALLWLMRSTPRDDTNLDAVESAS